MITEFRKGKNLNQLSYYCKSCEKAYATQYREKNKENLRSYHAQYQKKHESKLKAKFGQYYYKNREVLLKKQLEYAAKNRMKEGLRAKEWSAKNKERVLQNFKNWAKNNKQKIALHKRTYVQNNLHKSCAATRKRQLLQMNRIPKWLTSEQYKEIENYYLLAQELKWLSEDPLEVDHIIPLTGENVSGLHVPWNLQIMPRSMNRSKRNNVYEE